MTPDDDMDAAGKLLRQLGAQARHAAEQDGAAFTSRVLHQLPPQSHTTLVQARARAWFDLPDWLAWAFVAPALPWLLQALTPSSDVVMVLAVAAAALSLVLVFKPRLFSRRRAGVFGL